MNRAAREGLSSVSSSLSAKFADGRAKEFFWGCELTKDKQTIAWNFEEEDEDHEFLEHTLFLRHAVLGDGADSERNIIQVETKNFQGEDIKHPIASLCGGKMEMCTLDLNFSGEIPVMFRLVKGNGPVHLTAQQLVEFPHEEQDDFDTETEYTATETEDLDTGDEEDDEEVNAKKRKASNGPFNKKSKRGKVDANDKVEECEDDDDDDDDDDEDMESEEEEDEEEESEDEVEKKNKTKSKSKKEAKDTKKKERQTKGSAAKKGKK